MKLTKRTPEAALLYLFQKVAEKDIHPEEAVLICRTLPFIRLEPLDVDGVGPVPNAKHRGGE